MGGVPLKVMQELLGHASITMTRRYSHLAPGVTRNAVEVLVEPVSGQKVDTAHEKGPVFRPSLPRNRQ